MMSQFVDAMKRIVVSRKFQTGVAGVLSSVFVVFLDVDFTEQILELIGWVTTTLVGGQVVLDYKNGSPSDGTNN